jgi:hypothetical protein
MGFTWHSRDNPTLTPLASGDIVNGDHVILNATFPELNGSLPTSCLMTLTWNNHTVTRNSSDTPLLFDTYQLGENATISLGITGFYESGTELPLIIENLTVNNFFAPKVLLLIPTGKIDWSTGTHRITWHATDVNADDYLQFRIRFSNDGGSFWQILASGKMNFDEGNNWYYYDWTTTSLIFTDKGVIEVQAYDNDTIYAGRPHPLLPDVTLSSLWPGYSSIDTSDSFLFGGYTGGRPPAGDYASVSHPEDFTVFADDIGRFITWNIESNMPTGYTVFRNGTHILSGTIEQGEVHVPLGGLTKGTHVFEIRVNVPKSSLQEIDVVVVRLLERQSPILPPTAPAMIAEIGFAMSIGSFLGVPSLFGLLALRAWKRKEGY